MFTTTLPSPYQYSISITAAIPARQLPTNNRSSLLDASPFCTRVVPLFRCILPVFNHVCSIQCMYPTTNHAPFNKIQYTADKQPPNFFVQSNTPTSPAPHLLRKGLRGLGCHTYQGDPTYRTPERTCNNRVCVVMAGRGDDSISTRGNSWHVRLLKTEKKRIGQAADSSETDTWYSTSMLHISCCTTQWRTSFRLYRTLKIKHLAGSYPFHSNV